MIQVRRASRLCTTFVATMLVAAMWASVGLAGTKWHAESYSSHVAAANGAGTSSTILTPAKPKGRIARLVVTVRLTTASARSVTLTLKGPGVSQPVTLASPGPSSANSPDGADFGSGSLDCSGAPAIFDDAGKTYFDQALPPFQGVFHPSPNESLTAFLAAPAGGKWTLQAQAPIPVTIDCWTMRITREVVVRSPLFAVPDLRGANVNTLFRKAVSGPWSAFRMRYDCHPLRYPITIQENRRSDVVAAQSPAPGKRVLRRTPLRVSFVSSDWHAGRGSSCFASGTPGG
jgi:hypothetical protein